MRQAGDVCFSEVYRDRDGKHVTVIDLKNFGLKVARTLQIYCSILLVCLK